MSSLKANVMVAVFLIVVSVGVVYGIRLYDSYMDQREADRLEQVEAIISFAELDSVIVSMSMTDADYVQTVDSMSIFDVDSANVFKTDAERKRYMVNFLKSFVDMKRIDYKRESSKKP
jgi:uncharacterized membrane protein